MMKGVYRFLFGTLRGRLIVGVAVVHAVMMALFIADLTVRQRALLLNRQREEATALSHALATSAAGWIAAADISGLQEIAEAQQRYPEIIFVILADKEGRVLADLDTSRQGLYMQDLPGAIRQTVISSTPALVDVVTPAIIAGHHVGWARIGIGQKTTGKKLAEITRSGVLYALAAILIGSVIAWLMGRRITRRLYAVQETMDTVRSGNRLARVTLAGADEAAGMAYEFNRMLDAREEAEAALLRLNRELRAISNCNQVLMRAEDEQSLLGDICRIICEEAGYRMAWVGYAENDAARSIRPVAWAGAEEGYLEQGGFTWADTEEGRRPAGTAIRGGETVCIQDINTAQRTGPWGDSALQRDYRSTIALPLLEAPAKPFGVLVLYSPETNAFTAEEIKLLEELAGDLAFGITVLRTRVEGKQAQQRIALLSFALDNVHESAFLIDEQARFQYVNEESSRALGYSRDALLELGVPDVDPDFPAERWVEHWHALKAQRSFTFEGRHRARDGRIFPVEINANYFEYDGQGYNLAMVRDITERKRAEEERLAHLRFFEAMDRINRAIQGARDLDTMMSDVLDTVLAIFDCDRAFLMYPCDPEAVTWSAPMERTRPEYPGVLALGRVMPMDAEVAATLRVLLASADPVKFGPAGEYPLPDEVAEQFGFKSFMAMAIHPKVGKPWQFGIHQCSAPRVWSGEEERLLREIGRRLADALTSLLTHRDLRESEEFLGNIVENIPNMIFVKEAAGLRFVRFNKAGEQLLGYSRQELLGRNDYDFFPKEVAEFFTAKDREVLKKKELVDIPEEPIRTRSNEERILHTKKIPLLDETGMPKYLLGISEDITERKQSVELIREREAFIRNMLDSVDEGFIVVDREYRVLSANKAFCAMVDLPEDQVVGRLCYAVSHHVGRPCFEQGGDCQECAVRRTFETGIPHAATHVHKDAAGAKHHMELKSFPITDASGRVVSAIETINDVTEKTRLEEQLVQAQKMDAVGRLAGGVAHDFNNMLSVILGHADLGIMKVDPAQPLYANLQEILKAANRSADLTRQLLAFARRQTITPKVLDLNETVEGMLKLLRRLIGENIDLAWLPRAGVWPIMVDPSQIDQILANLCVNARDAIAGQGKVTIETGNAAIDARYCADHPEVVPGDYVLLVVSDNGCGMDRQTLTKIFEPFYTTKERGKGTGLGLATVYGIVKQNSGFINVYSEPDHGTSFKIYLPRHATEAGQPQEEALAAPLTGGHETIMLVEDESAILEMAQEILEGFGYRVLAAATPGDAIRTVQDHDGGIDLLLTDVVMPEMNGPELAKKLGALHPGLRCLFMSGYTGDVIILHGMLDGGGNFIQKPFSVQSLTAKVREILDSK